MSEIMSHIPLEDLVKLARAWADADPDPATATLLREWMDASNEFAIRECFELPLEFGTAGIRGIVGPGPARMNLAVVRRVTRALAEYLAQNHGAGSAVVLGRDARLDSARFAREAAAVLLAAGCSILQFETPTATPLVAFAALQEQTAAGIVVTASHNSRDYNGYKVYGANAIQIVSPVDTLIAERMNCLPAARDIPVAFEGENLQRSHKWLGAELLMQYQESVLKSRPAFVQYPLRIAYTPLHGVGWKPVQALFQAAGHTNLQPVPAQVEPDGRFPTVQFPNPEEPDTLSLGVHFADEIDAHLLLANDPDADRLAMALPDAAGNWHVLTGNQLGIVLMDYLLGRPRPGQSLVVSTVVSTPMVDALAAAHHARLERTLTGFKWLWTAALALLKDESLNFAIAWEEALGYSTHGAVRDKDGVAAALVAADWAAACHASGTLPWNRLGKLYRDFGAWASRQVSLHKPGIRGATDVKTAFERLASSPPAEVDRVRIVAVEDYRTNTSQRPSWRGCADLVILHLADDSRVLARPSGTEPKLKLYIDVPADVNVKADPFVVLQRANKRADYLGRWLVNWLSR
jgi:phosphomannomutase